MTLFDLPEDQATASPGRDARDSVRVRLVVAYDGSGFHGFAVNRGVRTVGGLLTEALQTVLGHPVEISFFG